jgi:hypothetical protein
VSWLLVAFIPGLLMLATFGLDRLENGITRDTVTATDVAEFLEQAQADDVRTLAMEGMPEALDGMARRRNDHESAAEDTAGDPFDEEWSNLPGKLYMYNPVNPEFRQSRPTNRV